MNIFVVGASGAIGLPLVKELIRQGHTVTGMSRSEGGAKNLARIGAGVARVSAFDAAGVETALRRSKAEVVIDQLTALPKSPADMPDAAAGNQKLRLEGGANLYRAARACGVRRYQFLIKDLVLLGVSLWIFGESLKRSAIRQAERLIYFFSNHIPASKHTPSVFSRSVSGDHLLGTAPATTKE